LNESQRKHIKDALEHIPDLSASWLAYRAQQTNALLAMLETGAEAETLRAYLNDWWVHRDGTSNETRHEFAELMNDLAMTLSDRQRRILETQLADLRKELATFL